MLDKEAPECINNVPQVGASAVLVTIQDPQRLATLAHGAAQNQQELSAVVQGSLEVSVYGDTIVDKIQLWGVSPHQSLSHTFAPGSNSNPHEL